VGLYATLAATGGLAGAFSVIVVALIVAGSIASLNTTVTAVLRLTPVAPAAGLTVTTVGGVVSGTSVVKVEV
jgi:hypothetical protein